MGGGWDRAVGFRFGHADHRNRGIVPHGRFTRRKQVFGRGGRPEENFGPECIGRGDARKANRTEVMFDREGFCLGEGVARDGGDMGPATGAVKVDDQLVDGIGRCAIKRAMHVVFGRLGRIDGEVFDLVVGDQKLGTQRCRANRLSLGAKVGHCG
ncbi:MAG: hypothetical protein LC676_13275 [Loktanella sp.]|nr:hypothetical protein [Loktanella sp.]